MHKATHLEGEPEGGFFAKYSKLLGTGLAASLNAIGKMIIDGCRTIFNLTSIITKKDFNCPEIRFMENFF